MNTPEYWEDRYFQSKMLWPDFVKAVQADALRHAAEIVRRTRMDDCYPTETGAKLEAEADKLKAS